MANKINSNKKTNRYSKSTFDLAIKLCRKNIWLMLFTLLFSIVNTLIMMIPPAITKHLVDNEIDPSTGIKDMKRFTIIILLYLAMLIASGIITYFKARQARIFSNKIGYDLRKDFFSHATKLPMSFYDNTPVGKVTSRVVGDINEIQELFNTGIDAFLSTILFIVGTIIYIAIIEPSAVVFLIIPIPLSIILTFIYNRFQVKPNIDYRKQKSQVTSDMNEIVKGTSTIQSFAVEEEALEEFKAKNEKLYGMGKKIEMLDSLLSYNVSNVLLQATNAFIILFFGFKFLNGENNFTIGLMLLVIQYTSSIYEYIKRITSRLAIFEKGLSSMEHINEVLNKDVENDSDIDIIDIKGEVEFRDIYHEYIKDVPVLKGISFKRPVGSSTALVGNTGSGKSSIISLIFKFYEPRSGKILIDGNDISTLSLKSLRGNMAMVLQDPFLFKGTLRDNITLGEDFSDKEVIDALMLSGGSLILDKLRHGLDTNLLGEDGGLSLGEKQIVNFARTIIRDPKILVLDEATASIDTETEKYIQEGINNLMKGRTTFIVAHRLSTIKNCDQILVLDKGEIIESGSHDELMKLHGKYYELANSKS